MVGLRRSLDRAAHELGDVVLVGFGHFHLAAERIVYTLCQALRVDRLRCDAVAAQLIAHRYPETVADCVLLIGRTCSGLGGARGGRFLGRWIRGGRRWRGSSRWRLLRVREQDGSE